MYSYFMSTKGMGKGKVKEWRTFYCRHQGVVGPNWGLPAENVFLVGRNRVLE